MKYESMPDVEYARVGDISLKLDLYVPKTVNTAAGRRLGPRRRVAGRLQEQSLDPRR